MRVMVRADASIDIGIGHVMRCLTLADALARGGATVEFFSRDTPGNLIHTINQRGYLVHTLSASEDHAEFAAQDSAAVSAVLAQTQSVPDWIVIDHYGVGKTWEKHLRPLVHRAMVIDDLANREHDCDLLLDQNFSTGGAARYDGLVPSGCRVLAGPAYAMLRQEFIDARQKIAARSGRVGRIVISFGGSDTARMTARTMEALHRLPGDGLRVSVIPGPVNPASEQLRELAAAYGMDWGSAGSLAELFSQADLAVGGGGTTMWERACLGVPSVIAAIAANQEPGGAAMGQEGYAIYLGRAHELSDQSLQQALAAVIADEPLRHSLSRRSMELVDGNGVDRVVNEMMVSR